jgi:hypothetical protein
MVAEPRPIAPARRHATVADLREKGAEDVRAADTSQVVGGIAAAGGVVGAAGSTLEQLESYSALLKRAADVFKPVQTMIVDNIWFLLVCVGSVVVYQAYQLKKIRVEKHRTGQDVSE